MRSTPNPRLLAAAAIVGALGVAAAALALSDQSRPVGRDPSGSHRAMPVVAPWRSRAPDRIALASRAIAANGVAAGVLDQASVNLRGTFRAQTGIDYRVYEGTLLPNSPLNQPGSQGGAAGGAPAPVPPAKTCVALRGGGALALSCAAAPFARSSVLFVEAAVGGPAPTARRAFEIGGLTAPGVDRVEAVDSTGNVHAAQVSAGHAFFVELARDELAAGKTIESLRLRGASGALLEQVDA